MLFAEFGIFHGYLDVSVSEDTLQYTNGSAIHHNVAGKGME